jgi:hypothetical protein
MTGFLGFAPIYINGLLAIFFVFVLPGLVLVRAFDISDFPHRWLAVFLGSLTANHSLATLIATFHLDPLQTYRAVAAALIAALFCIMAKKSAVASAPMRRSASILLLSDVKWLVGSLVVLGFTYFNIWRHGVPNIFHGSDVSVSWDVWALIWSHGLFPNASYGYPQFIPTTWAATYIFTGSTEQYFAYYTYIVLIIAPIVLTMAVLGRLNWRYAASLLFVFAWFVAEIREPWIRSTLQEGFPDWVAAIFAYCGAVLLVVGAPAGRFDREKIVTALLSLCLVSIAAMTKPIYGLVAIAVLIAICRDAVKWLPAAERNRFIVAAVGLLAIFVAAYAIYYSHLVVRSMPHYPVTELSERLSRAVKLLNSNFTLPYRILLVAGLALSPFLPRVRWLALPLAAGFWLWANTASYDLRNILGILLITAFIPLYAVANRLATARDASHDRQWLVRDRAITAAVAVLCVVLTLPLALSDEKLKQRFAHEQMIRGYGIEINRNAEKLLARGCKLFSVDAYITTIAGFQKFLPQIHFFHVADPLSDQLTQQINESTGCTGILYPPRMTHPSILDFIAAQTRARGYTKVVDHNGMELLASDAKSPAKN